MRARGVTSWVAAACAAAVLTACTGAPATDPGGPSSPSATPPEAKPQAGPTEDAGPAEPQVLAVVTHHTRPVPRPTARQVGRLVERPPTMWRGRRLVERVGAVARNPDAYAVVPVDRVTPFVRVAGLSGRPPGPVTTLRIVGDVMLGRGVPSAKGALRPMSGFLRSADLTVGNLESTLSDSGPALQGGDSFAAPGALPHLARAGFDALSLANNHTGDFGGPALRATWLEVNESPIRPFGLGSELDAASRGVILSRNGLRFGFIGFNAIGETPRATRRSWGAYTVRMPPRTGPLVPADLDHLARSVRRLQAMTDVVVVVPHWGEQYTHVADPIQRLVARRVVQAGADLVVGSHPHWVQGLERVGDAVLAHSLGNFVFDMDFSEQTMQGVVLTATFWGDRLRAVELTPYRMDASFAPHRAIGAEAADILGDVWAHSTGPFAPVS